MKSEYNPNLDLVMDPQISEGLKANEGLPKHFRDEVKKMEALKDLMVANGDDKSRIFYLKVIIIRPGFSEEWMVGLRWI